MSLLQTLIRPDHDEHPERAEAARAANLLQVGESQLIQLAYAEWFGHDMAEETSHKLFHAYMLHDVVPHWVRHYARRILALDAAGLLDGDDPAYHRFDPPYMRAPAPGTRRTVMAAAAIVVCLGGALLISQQVTGKATSFLPPYFTEEELRR
jgi:hypothetical protein